MKIIFFLCNPTCATGDLKRAPSTTAIFNRNRDVQPDRGCDCCWWSTHTRSDRSVQSFSVESQFSTMSDLDSDDLANIALFLEAQLTRSGRFCPYTTATSTATLSSAHQISENSDQQQPQQRSASHGGGCGCRSPYTGNLVEVAVGNRGCDWRSLSWMRPFTEVTRTFFSQICERWI